MSCRCDQCASCFKVVAEYERMNILRVGGKLVCAHPGNCTQQLSLKQLLKGITVTVVSHNVRAEKGIVLPETRAAVRPQPAA